MRELSALDSAKTGWAVALRASGVGAQDSDYDVDDGSNDRAVVEVLDAFGVLKQGASRSGQVGQQDFVGAAGKDGGEAGCLEGMVDVGRAGTRWEAEEVACDREGYPLR